MREDEKSTNAINMTPLVDVSLTLVLIFMVTMPPVLLHGVNIRREALKQYGLTATQENVMVHLTAQGIYIEDEKGVEQRVPYKDFGVVLRQLIQLSESREVYLRVDRNVPHGQTVWVLDLSKQNGASEIALMEG